MDAFTLVSWRADDERAEKFRTTGIRFERPREHRDHLACEQPERPSTHTSVGRNVTPPTVTLARCLSGQAPTIHRNKFGAIVPPPQPTTTPTPQPARNPHATITPTIEAWTPDPDSARFWTWRPGYRPSDCTPVW